VTLRPAGLGDRELLYRIYASTRADELANVPWDDDAKEGFLRAQFDAQDRWWREHYAGARFDVVIVDGEPAGRLYVHESEDEIRIVDIALLPAYRNRGIGSALLSGVLADGRRVTIHVERMNPALRLYERLGFTPAEDKGVYLFLERPARYVNTAS
jgi:ribosomal protein S18 acetylase RimI-like enzyme